MGIGYDFSNIRPKGTPTSHDAIASGAISFMECFDTQTATILQGGRRGANMGTMSIYSMDIEDFIYAKSNNSDKFQHFNLSVMVDDLFMEAVKENSDMFLHFPVYDEEGKIIYDPSKWKQSRKVNAKELWEKIIQLAYDTGEPGILFYDTMNKNNNVSYCETISCVNPCAEYIAGTINPKIIDTNTHLTSSDFGGACNLGSLMLHKFVLDPFTDRARIDSSELHSTIKIAVRMLDNIIDKNNYPDRIYENYQMNLRTIGLGVTGLADMLVMLGLKYNSQEACDYVDELMDFITRKAYQASIKLAKEKGSFPYCINSQVASSSFIQEQWSNTKLPSSSSYVEWKAIQDDIKQYGIRNARLISIAPTGTLSLVFGNNCSSGIEPIFSLETKRTIKVGGQQKENEQEVILRDYAWDIYTNPIHNNLQKAPFITALQMTPMEHIEMLRVIAKHVDMGISKTINIPEDYSFEETKEIYMKCWEWGIKGCTIFRPNALRQGILTEASKSNSKPDKTQSNIKTPEVKEDRLELQRGDVICVSDDLVGQKTCIVNGCGKFHLSQYFDDVTGEPLETFIDIGGEGGCEKNLQFISRLISTALRGGIPIETVIDQAMSIRPCPAYIARTMKKKDTSKGSSCPTAIGFGLKELNDRMQSTLFDDEEEMEDVVKEIIENSYGCDGCTHSCKGDQEEIDVLPKCPDCSEPLQIEGGCNVCVSCGYSSCS